jgi:uncharacterized protein DUF4886
MVASWRCALALLAALAGAGCGLASIAPPPANATTPPPDSGPALTSDAGPSPPASPDAGPSSQASDASAPGPDARAMTGLDGAAPDTTVVSREAGTAGADSLPREAGAMGSGPRVLFIGNSLTYYNDLPGMLNRLAASGPAPGIVTSAVTAPNATLLSQWQMGNAQKKIAEATWDYVVLQDVSTQPLTNPAAFFEYARRFDELIRAAGAETILYLTWAWRGPMFDVQQDQVTAAYTKAAHDSGAILAPAGLAWKTALHEMPALDLYDPDGNHPNVLGTYLIASVFYQTITGRSPVPLTHLPAGVSAERASYLRDVARRTVEATPRKP